MGPVVAKPVLARQELPTAAATRLRVRLPDGSVRVMDFPGASEAAAIKQAAARGLLVQSIERQPLGAANETSVAARAQVFPVLLFSQELLALLEAGLNLTEALETLHAKERQAAPKLILAQLLQGLREGRSLSDVLAGQGSGHFSAVYVATVRASERTGDLSAALSRYVAYQLQFEGLRKKLVSAAIYPAMLLVVGTAVTLFLLGYVVPRFSVVYETTGRDIPWLSQLLLSFGKLLYSHWQLALVVVLAAFGSLIWGLSQAAGRRWLLGLVLRFPWLARKSEEFRLARFYRAVGLLLASGIALPRAMGMVAGLLSARQQQALSHAKLAIEQGQSLSIALVVHGLANPVTESLLKVGERSGQMADMLERSARFADEAFARWVDWASRLLEPILMLVIGAVVGTVVVLLYMPIFDLAGSLQ